MKKLFLILLLSSSMSSAGVMNWLQDLFLNKQYQGIQAYRQQDYDQALESFHELMNNDPYNPEYNYNVGNVLYKQKKYDDAKQAYARAIDHARKSSKLSEQAHLNMGNSCYQLKEWQQAVDAYQQVLTIDIDNQQARQNLQLALYKLKEQELNDEPKSHEQQDKNQKNNDQIKNKNEEQSTKDKNQSQSNQADNQSQDSGEGDERDCQESSDALKKDQKETSKKDQKQSDKKNKNDQSKHDEDGQGYEEQENGKSSMDDMNEEKSDSSQSSRNQLQDVGDEKQNSDDLLEKIDQAEPSEEDEKIGQQDAATPDHEKKETGGYKKPELKNQLKDAYESKASDDERLTDYHASVMKTLEDLEEKIQKHVIKNKVAMQGSGQHGKKGW